MDVSSRENFTTSDIEDITTFWQRMQDIYGAKWSGQYGPSPVDEYDEVTEAGRTWLRQYQKLNVYQLKRAFVDIADRIKRDMAAGKESWPPAPMEFYAMAVDTTAVDWEHKRYSQPLHHADDTRPKLAYDPMKGKSPADYIAEMRKLVGLDK